MPSSLLKPSRLDRKLFRRSMKCNATYRDQSPIESLTEALTTGIARLQRQIQPPPEGFPAGPRGDAALQLLNDPLEFLRTTNAEYGDVVGLLLAGERVILVSNPSVAREILIDKADIFIKAGTAFFPGSKLAGNGLLVSDGDVWKRQRQLSNPAFRNKAIDQYTQSMVAAAQKMSSQKWRDSGIRDIYKDFNQLTLIIVLEALFGSKISESGGMADEVIHSIREAFEFFAQRSSAAFTLPEWVPVPENIRFNVAVSRLDKAVYKLIADRRDDILRNRSPRSSDTNLLTALIQARDENGMGMTDEALRDELMTLLVAGQETSAIALAWACALLATHPDAQEKAYEEIARCVERSDGPFTLEQAEQLHFIEAILLEALRLAPPAYLIGRCASQSVQLEHRGSTITAEKGTTILIAPYLLHRDERWWGQDAHYFNPDRWMHIASSEKKSLASVALSGGMGFNGAYIPFGAGQRSCIGTRFAMLEGVLVLATLLREWELKKPVPNMSRRRSFPRPDPRITLRPQHVNVTLSYRK